MAADDRVLPGTTILAANAAHLLPGGVLAQGRATQGHWKILVLDVVTPTVATGRITVDIPGVREIAWLSAHSIGDDGGTSVFVFNEVSASHKASSAASAVDGAEANIQVTTKVGAGAAANAGDGAMTNNVRLFVVGR